MSDYAFRALVNLVRFDQEVDEFKKTIIQLQQNISQLEEQEKQLLQELIQVKQQVHDWRKTVDEQELEMKMLDEQEKEKIKRLEEAHNQKEYKAIKSEIDHLKQAQHDFEQEVIDAWNKLETAEKEYESKQKKSEEKLAAVHSSINNDKQKVSNLELELAQHVQQRPGKVKKVPEEWLEKYAAMGSRVSNPVIPILHGSCSFCFFTITSQDIVRLKRGALLECKGCFRFLYAPKAMEQEQTTIKAVKADDKL